MWAAFLIPSWASPPSKTDKSVKDFERNMDMLAETESPGRWIVTPRKGTTFIGLRARAQARARERRRRVLMVLIESLVLTALIGLVPPLRAVWDGTGRRLDRHPRAPPAQDRRDGTRGSASRSAAVRGRRLEPHNAPVVQRPARVRRRPREHRGPAPRRTRSGSAPALPRR